MSYLRGPLTKEQIATLTRRRRDRRRPPQAPPVAAVRGRASSARARSRRGRARPPCRIPRRRGSRRSAATPTARSCAPFSPRGSSVRFDDTAAELDTTEEWEALYGPLDNGLDLDSETPVDYDERDFRPDAARRRVVRRCPSSPLAEDVVLPRRPEPDRAAPPRRPQHAARSSATAPLKLFSRPGETEEQFAARADEAAQAAADERGRADPRPARGQAGPARGRARDSPTPGRGARGRTALADDDRAARRRRQRAQRPARRPRAHADDRPRRHARSARPRRRRGMTARAAERRRTAEQKVEEKTDALEELEQEILDEVAEIDRTLGRAGEGDRDASRSARRRPTCASSSSRSCGCRRPDRALLALALAARRSRVRRRMPPRRSVESARVDPVTRRRHDPAHDGRRVRLVQVDAPELRLECYGDQASADPLERSRRPAPRSSSSVTRASTTPTASAASYATRSAAGRSLNVALVRARRGGAVLLPRRARALRRRARGGGRRGTSRP